MAAGGPHGSASEAGGEVLLPCLVLKHHLLHWLQQDLIASLWHVLQDRYLFLHFASPAQVAFQLLEANSLPLLSPAPICLASMLPGIAALASGISALCKPFQTREALLQPRQGGEGVPAGLLRPHWLGPSRYTLSHTPSGFSAPGPWQLFSETLSVSLVWLKLDLPPSWGK